MTAAPSPTASRTDIVEFSCTRGDTGEQCCQRAPNPPLHWCSGKFPNFSCYNAKNQFCCTDGTVCDEENCCELFVRTTEIILDKYTLTDPFIERLHHSPVGLNGDECSHRPARYHSSRYHDISHNRPSHSTSDVCGWHKQYLRVECSVHVNINLRGELQHCAESRCVGNCCMWSGLCLGVIGSY